MAWYDTKIDYVTGGLPASEWNTMVPGIQHQYPGGFFIYKVASTYYAKNLDTALIDYTSTLFGELTNTCIDTFTNAGRIYLGQGQFDVETSILFGLKAINFEGTGWGKNYNPWDYPGTVLKPTAALNDYVFKTGAYHAWGTGALIKNIVIHGIYGTTCPGAIELYNTQMTNVERVYIVNFPMAGSKGIYVHGDNDASWGGWYNHISDCRVYLCRTGIHIGHRGNNTFISGGAIEGGFASGTEYGIVLQGDGVGPGPDTCQVTNTDVAGFNADTSSCAVVIGNCITYGGMHRFMAMRTEGNSKDVSIGTTNCGRNSFVACNFSTTVADGALTSINKSMFFGCAGYKTANWGVTTITSGLTGVSVSHNLNAIPTWVNATGSSLDTNELYITSITASTFIINTGFDVEANRLVYWRAEV